MRLLILLFIGLFWVSCQPTEQEQQGEPAQEQPFIIDIDIEQFSELSKESNTVILDVRTPQEIAQGKIDGAIEIDFLAPDFAKAIRQLDKKKAYLVYCRSGNRSTQACQVMEEEGFGKLYNMLGGYNAWSTRH